MTAARVVWDSPDLSVCNIFKGYQVYLSKFNVIFVYLRSKSKQIYLDEVEYECTTECGITISSLTASTAYQIDVCAVSNKGKGPRTSLNIITASAGRLQSGKKKNFIYLSAV
jgi:hypothetical protein